MKIVFCEPPSGQKQTPERFLGCSYELYHFPDLANLYLAAILAKAGHEVAYIDANLEGFGIDQFQQKAKASRADAFVIHSVILAKKIDVEIGALLLKQNVNAQLWYHGPEPTRLPEEYLLNERTVVLRGEPELNALNLAHQEATVGVSRVVGGSVVHEQPNSKLVEYDDLPHPARWIEGIAEHRDRFYNPKFRNKPFTTMMASRGCAFRCKFCVPNSISFAREIEHLRYFDKKPPVRQASAAYAAEEFNDLAHQGYRSVMIVDDQFLWNKERTLAFCDAVADSGITWGCLSRADFLTDPAITSALAKAGCISVDIGVESLDQTVLTAISKDLDPDTVQTAIANLDQAGVEPKLNIIFGTCPQETQKMAQETVRKLYSMNLDRVMFSIATPFKGSRFYEACKADGYLIDESDKLDPMHKSMISYPHFSAEELEKTNRWAYRSFYLRPKIIWRRIKSLRSPSDFFRDLLVALRIFR